MSAMDKLKNKAQELQGEAKQRIGRAKGDDSLEVEGKQDQATGNLKSAGENVKDAFK